MLLVAVGALVLVAALVGGYVASRLKAPVPDGSRPPQRLVSLAPSVTETLFAIGAGDRVVGVTDYCSYPGQVKDLPRIGALMNPNFEAMVALNPDLVVIREDQPEIGKRLQELGIETLALEQNSIDGIMESILVAGRALGTEAQATELHDILDAQIRKAQEAVSGRAKRRVLLVYGGMDQSVTERRVTIAGRNNVYDELIQLAGGTNAYEKVDQPAPSLTLEGVLALDPDVIVELAGDSPTPDDALREAWAEAKDLRAVEQGNIVILRGEHVFIPGPRFVQTLADLTKALHPEAL